MFECLDWQYPSVILSVLVQVLIDSCCSKCKCNNGTFPITNFVFKAIYNGSIFNAFRKVIPSFNFQTMLLFYVGSFHQILRIHPIITFSGNWLFYFGHKIEFSFYYHDLFLLKKQNKYPPKFNCVNFF